MQKMQVFPLPKTTMMKRFAKKVLAATTAASMMVSMSGISVCASDATLDTKTTNVTYEVTQSYSWSVPSIITLGTTEATDTVSASDCILPSGTKLQITAAGSGTGGAFTVATDGGQPLAYTITVGSAADAIASGGEVLAVNAGSTSGTAPLKFKLADSATMAGTYSGTVTYTASVVAQ